MSSSLIYDNKVDSDNLTYLTCHRLLTKGSDNEKIFIDAPLDTMITIPKDTTHHLLTVFRHKMEKPVLVGGSDGRTGVYQIQDVVDGEASAKLVGDIQDESVSEVEVVLVQGF